MRLSISILLSLIIFSSFPGLASANMDPKSATPSATATVPASAPSTGDTTSPSNPILIRPQDDTTTGDNRPEFVWKESIDPNGNFVSYTVYLNGIATYLGISNLGNTAGNNYVSRLEGNEIKLRPQNPIQDGYYNWYIVANDASGNQASSTTWNFVIDTQSPPITITDIDSYHLPTIIEGSNFDIAGPKDIYITLHSDPFTTIQLAITTDSQPPIVLVGTSDTSGNLSLYTHFLPGIYQIIATAIDSAGNTTSLPSFTLTITQAVFTITIPQDPGSSPKPIINIPYKPINIPSFPATISLISSRYDLSMMIAVMLAILLLVLLILLWKRRSNLYLVDQAGNPILTATIYHSIPTDKLSNTQVLVTNHLPILYSLRSSNRGKIYIRHLSRYSTLTIRLEGTTTYVLSIAGVSRLYKVQLG